MTTTVKEIPASYIESRVPEHRGNPLIEALPPEIANDMDVMAALENLPKFSADERTTLSSRDRAHCVYRLDHIVIPTADHVDMEHQVARVIRNGYVGRNPLDSVSMTKLFDLAQKAQTGVKGLWWRKGRKAKIKGASLLTGLSGMGKTTMLDGILDLYPQRIFHAKLHQTQITWLKIDCPFDASLKTLALDFFRALDQVTGEKTYDKFTRGSHSTSVLLGKFMLEAYRVNLGLLVVDEVQNLKLAKDESRDRMLSFFVQLANEINVPIIFVGTYKVSGVFNKEMRAARRAVADIPVHLVRPDPGNDDGRYQEWVHLAKTIWSTYQWVEEPAPWTSDIEATLYQLTQGVTDFLIKLMQFSQWTALRIGKKTVDEKWLRKTYNEHLGILHPAIEALTAGKEQGDKIEDLFPSQEKWEELRKAQSGKAGPAERLRLLEERRRKPQDSTRAAMEILGAPSDSSLKKSGDTAEPDKKESALPPTTISKDPIPKPQLSAASKMYEPDDLRALASAPNIVAALLDAGHIAEFGELDAL